MANFNSDIITNIVATPPVKNSVGISHGRRRTDIGKHAFTGAQADGDTLRMLRVSSSAVVHSLSLSNDALSGMLDVNFGVYGIGNSGAAVDDNLFDDAQTLASALVRQEKRVGANSALGIETIGFAVWQLLGLSADPGIEYDVVMTLVDSGVASGDVTLEMEYTAGD